MPQIFYSDKYIESLPPENKGGQRVSGEFRESSKNQPLLTVATVVKNDPENLSKTLHSVISQTYRPLEFIIIDGGCDEATRSFLHDFDDRIDLWISEPDSGIYEAMNKALKVARGEIINFMNAGDRFLDVNTVEKVMQMHNSGDLIYGGQYMDFGKAGDEKWREAFKKFGVMRPDLIDENGNCLVKWWDDRFKTRHLWQRMIFSHQSLFIRTNIARFYGFNTNNDIIADFEMIFRAYLAGFKFYNLGFPVSVIHYGGYSDKNIRKRTLQRWKFVRKHIKNFYLDSHYLLTYLGSFLPGPMTEAAKKVTNYFRFRH